MPGGAVLRTAAWLLTGLALLGPPAAPSPGDGAGAGSRPDPEAAALVVERRLGALQEIGDEESRLMLAAAIAVAGDAAVPVLLGSLERDWREPRAAAAAWGLGEALRPAPGVAAAPAGGSGQAVEALRRALRSPAADVRLASASALGILEAREAEADLLDLLLEPGLTPQAEDVLLLALAGMRGRALSMLEARLERGGDERWSRAVVSSFLRWGGDAWPVLSRQARRSPDVRVRATALTCLVLLAEPASACEIAELYGTEPEPVLRRVILQALAATRHPLARDMLALVARTESQPQLAELARLLVESLGRERELYAARAAGTGPRHSVPELLADLERQAGYERHVDEIEERADPVHVGFIELLLRRLPLRGDSRALVDHARLAQVRARLLCRDGLDCEEPAQPAR